MDDLSESFEGWYYSDTKTAVNATFCGEHTVLGGFGELGLN